MGETEGEEIAEVPGVGKTSRIHRDFRYLTEVRKMTASLGRMAVFPPPILLTK